MYIRFKYNNGSNPYIATKHNTLFDMIYKYNLHEESENVFRVLNEREKYPKTYANKRYILQEFALMWLDWFCDCRYSRESLAQWGAFFEEYGKKYGLLREFRANGLC